MKTVFEFSNYRKFLNYFYQHRKSHQSNYSYKKFSENAGLKSPNYLKLVISGQKNLTVANIHQFATALELSHKEYEFFETLVLSNQSKKKSEKSFYQERLKRLKEVSYLNRSKRHMRALVYSYYTPAFLLYFEDKKTKDKDTLLKKCTKIFNITFSEAMKVYEQLIESKVLVCLNGSYRIQAKYLYTQDKKSMYLDHKNFLRNQIQLSLKNLDENYGEEAKFYSHTLKLHPDCIEDVNKLFQKYLEEITILSEEQKGEQIIQINGQIFNY